MAQNSINFNVESLRNELAKIFNESQHLKNSKKNVKEFMKIYKSWVCFIDDDDDDEILINVLKSNLLIIFSLSIMKILKILWQHLLKL